MIHFFSSIGLLANIKVIFLTFSNLSLVKLIIVFPEFFLNCFILKSFLKFNFFFNKNHAGLFSIMTDCISFSSIS